MIWAFQDRIVRYLRELVVKEGTCGFNDDKEFIHWRRGLFFFWTVSFIVVRILWMLKDLNRSVISLRELIRLSCWTGVSFGTWYLG